MKRFIFGLLTLGVLSSAAAFAEPESRWLTSVDQARKQAADGDRFILVDLQADWCGWCKVLEEKVFSTADFQAFTKDWVLLRVDVEDGGEGTDLQARFRASSLPTTLILDKDLVRVGEVRGFQPVQRFLAFLTREVMAYRGVLDFYEKVRKDPGDRQLLRQVAGDLHERGDGTRAAELYEKLLEKPPFDAGQRAWLWYALGDASRLAKNFPRAEAALDQAREIQDLPESLSEKIDLLAFYIAQDTGDCTAAVSSLEVFLRKHPASAQRRQAEQTLTALKKKSDGTVCA